jgi:4-amino-4-deoxy-L-arabinose transferase-like glycosyltransferase
VTAATFEARPRVSATLLALGGLAALTAVRLMLAANVELHFDEAYYWYWSKNLQASYFDHPPAIAWFIRAGTALFGDTELGVRLLGQLSLFAATIFLFDAARRAFSLQSALIVAAATQATVLLGVGSIIMTPDAPLMLFTAIVLWGLVRFTLAPAGWWWLLVGLAGGGALLSKYTAGLLAVAVALWVVSTPQIRVWLARPWPWLGALLTTLCFLPVLISNAERGWTSFAKQGGRLTRMESPRPALLFEYIGAQMGVITPGLFILLLLAVWIMTRRAWRGSKPLDTLLTFWFLVPALFFLCVSPTMRIQANWLAPAWPAAFLALAALVDRWGSLTKMRQALFWSQVGGGAMVACVWLYAIAPFGPHWRADPLAGLNGQRALAADIATFARQNGSRQIIAPDYATASTLRFYAPADMAVAQITEEARYAGFSVAPLTMPAVMVTRRPPPLADIIAQRFRITGPPLPVWRNYRGKARSKYFLFIAEEERR